MICRPYQPAVRIRERQGEPTDYLECLGVVRGPRAPQQGQDTKRRKGQGQPELPFGLGKESRVGMYRGSKHLVIGDSGLDEKPTACLPAPDQA
jgi:hypothetical protein